MGLRRPRERVVGQGALESARESVLVGEGLEMDQAREHAEGEGGALGSFQRLAVVRVDPIPRTVR